MSGSGFCGEVGTQKVVAAYPKIRENDTYRPSKEYLVDLTLTGGNCSWFLFMLFVLFWFFLWGCS